MKIQSLNGNRWSLRSRSREEAEKIPALVPGSVYSDLLRAGLMEDPFWKDNEDKALELMDQDYEYSLSFSAEEELLACKNVLLHFDGLDTIADISLNGQLLGTADNMHRVWEYSVTELLKKDGNELTVLFHSPTKWIAAAYKDRPVEGSSDAMPGFVHMRKAHCMFGWDWGAHLPDAGIWRPVCLLGIDAARIDNVLILQEHKEDSVDLCFQVELNRFSGNHTSGQMGNAKKEIPFSECLEEFCYDVKLLSPDGMESFFPDSPERITVKEPKLWWPHGYGSQDLYTVTVVLKTNDGVVLDQWKKRIGLRTLTMDRSKNQWGENFHTTVNGVSVFAMGADYIPEDHILSRVTKETTRDLLEKCIFANFNAIRVWGGGYYPDDWFYDLCDELGLLVWQDFMFACAMYDLTPAFEKNITEEFKDNLKRIRSHASLALLCGNNEMEQFAKFRTWVSSEKEIRDYFIMYEYLISGCCEKLAPQTFYWPSSPSSGGSFDDPQDPERGDVHYWDVWHANKPFSDYRNYYFRYLSEFGFQSFPCESTINAITDDEKDKNIFSYVMERHQRNNAANGKIMNYMQQTYLYPGSFSTLLYASQLLQADAIRYGVEHFRRNRGRCMGAVYWQLNDCWPVASWSSLDYFHRLKALHYAAKRFFAPVMISCEEHGMMEIGQAVNNRPCSYEKSIRLNVANETRADVKGLVKLQIRKADGSILRSEETEILVPALTSIWLEKEDLSGLDVFGEYISFQFERKGETVSEGTVILSYPKYFAYQDPRLQVSSDGSSITVTASAYAKSVEITNDTEDLVLSDNYFDLNGDSKTVQILQGDPAHLKVRSVYDIR